MMLRDDIFKFTNSNVYLHDVKITACLSHKIMYDLDVELSISVFTPSTGFIACHAQNTRKIKPFDLVLCT